MKPLRKRVIPVLLLHKGGLYKTKKFGKPVYVGDPINAVRIFNEKEVDELVLLDIDASKEKRGPNFNKVGDIVSEAFMPVAYGGGITQMDQAEKLFFNGIEKVILNTVLFQSPEILTEIADRYGSQSVIASIDIKKNLFGKTKVYQHVSGSNISKDMVTLAREFEALGAGEIMLNSVDGDGTYIGYDYASLKAVSSAVDIPVIICGGASEKSEFIKAEEHGASAMAAGSMFVFQRPHNAVLISYDV